MPVVIVPVGLSMGQDFAEAAADGSLSGGWQVHLGTSSEDLTVAEVTVWGAAFVDPQRHARHEVNRQSLETLVRDSAAGVADPEPVVAGLLERGLLLEFDPAGGGLKETFGRLQLFPLVQGLGNSPEEPGTYQIGVAGEPLVGVNANIYAIWSYSLTGRSLWDACADLAEGVDEDLAPGEEPWGLTAEGIAGEVAAALPVLVATGCAFLDPVDYEL